MAKKIRVFGEVEMDIQQILENIQANLKEYHRLIISDSQPENALAERYYNYAEQYLEAGMLLFCDEPVCFEHGKKMELCNCGCGMYRCWDCVHKDEMAEKAK